MSKGTETQVAQAFKTLFDILEEHHRTTTRAGILAGWKRVEQEIPSLEQFSTYYWDNTGRMCTSCIFCVVRELDSFRSFFAFDEDGVRSFATVFFVPSGSIMVIIPSDTQDAEREVRMYTMGEVTLTQCSKLSSSLVNSFEATILGWKPIGIGKLA